MPASVHTKLLVAFVGTAVLVVGVAVLGLRVRGQANARMEMLGRLQERAFVYGKLQSDVYHVRLLLAENVASDFYRLNNPEMTPPRGSAAKPVDLAIDNALTRIGP